MKTKLNAAVVNLLNDSSDNALRYLKSDANKWGAADTLFWKARARTQFETAMQLAREFDIDVRATVTAPGFVCADDLPRSIYE